RSSRSSHRHNFNPHSSTFPITHRVRRKRQRLPSSLVIENPRHHTSGFYLYMTRRGFPMNANDYPENWSTRIVASPFELALRNRKSSRIAPDGELVRFGRHQPRRRFVSWYFFSTLACKWVRN